MRNLFFCGLLAVCGLTACEDDPITSPDPAPNIENKTSGFVIVGWSDSQTGLATYVEDLPESSIDLSSATDFKDFFAMSTLDGAIYSRRIDGTPGYSKLVVNSDGEIVEDGAISVVSNQGLRIYVKDADYGVYQDAANPNVVSVFNPTSMETTGSIDMSAGPEPEGKPNIYNEFFFRGDELFAQLTPASFDYYSGMYFHVANTKNNTYETWTGVASPTSGGLIPSYNFSQNIFDSEGNMYVADGGAIGTGTYARIYKIPAGSTQIDTSYVFQPVKVVNPQNVLFPTIVDFRVVSGNKAVARVNTDVPPAVIAIVQSMPGATYAEKLQSLYSEREKLEEVKTLLFTSPSAYWCELDLKAQTVTKIAGLPAVTTAGAAYTFEHDGEIYLPAINSTEQAYYKYTPGNPEGGASKAFSVTGANIFMVINLENNI